MRPQLCRQQSNRRTWCGKSRGVRYLTFGAPQAPDGPVVEQPEHNKTGPSPVVPSLAVQPKKEEKPLARAFGTETQRRRALVSRDSAKTSKPELKTRLA